MAGLTLGGGMGLTQRTFGLACDNLRSIEIVTGDGIVRTASPHEHADLFWAARGGGRGLGIVTSFEFDLHPLGPKVAVAQVAYDFDHGDACLRALRDLALVAPETISPEAALWALPADPALPEDLHGRRVVLIAVAFVGDPTDADDVLAPYRQLATQLVDMSKTMSYVALQAAFDPLVPDDGRYYFKSHFMECAHRRRHRRPGRRLQRMSQQGIVRRRPNPRRRDRTSVA